MPEDGYHGDYVDDLAPELPDDVWAAATAPPAPTRTASSGSGRPAASARASRPASRTSACASTSGRARLASTTRAGSLAPSSALREHGHVYEQDGAIWFRSTAYGDDKDRVIYRSNGEPTYFAADIGYVTEKFGRGFDQLIYVWGADHHGTVARLRNAAEAMGYDREAVQMLLYSWVRFVRDGEEVSMSKRAGEFITLDELLAEVGVDAARWFFASRAAHDRHRLRHRAGQEAVEREPGLLRPVRARADRLDPAQGGRGRAGAGRRGRGRAGGRARSRAGSRARALARGRRGRGAAEETHGITAFATELATTFHAFYRDAASSTPADPARSAARLALARGGPGHAGQRAGAAGDLRARVDVGVGC